MKKVILIAVVLASVFALYSCGNDDASTSGSTFTLKGGGN